LIAFLAERKLKLNPAKCKILKFRNKGRGRYKATDKLQIGNDDVEFVSDFVYLGVKFQASGLSFTKHIDIKGSKQRFLLLVNSSPYPRPP
jgi:hypothetical protein